MPANGQWSVASDGSNVLQSINGDPSFFVSPHDVENKVVRGKFKVETTGDDGMMIGHCSWAKDESRCPGVDVLGTDYGTGKGWKDNTEYEFELPFSTDRIRITIQGGTGIDKDGKVVFDITGDFPVGRFGFYNFSQSHVRHRGFTTNELPVARIAPVAPSECMNGGANVTLDGRASFDPDGDPITFTWSVPGVAFDDARRARRARSSRSARRERRSA